MLHILECSIFYFIFLEEKLVRLLSTLAHHVFHIVFVLNVVCSQLKNYIFIMFSCFIMSDCSVDVGAVIYNVLKI